ncbi:glutathione ABC transporter substrate-binding protein [Salipaludibacillus agaradhaerens]|uniref:Glutathione ABC transporter substrate-binding protein n=1 Tax=Salipaludibacillus agaradhaerens TaxID=76935 RepID=A0A9Q4B5D8_SALAG|nr:glutathione ABC transporter substrate-binding protein [Salipaludibacillus agaradhaerens]MCR6098681.1 glutathione ABC transporter substrate-binding protein [Salipaludibacillus agaradhaerens]MCR6115688.1 glutathione ABC transporter substrate-binding protein [Salipaludibacillus agaradhaerens]
MFKSKTLKAALLSASMVVALGACASEPDNNAGNDAAPADNGNANNAEGGDATDADVDTDNLVIGTLSDAEAMDPHGSNDVPSSNVQTNIFETLVKHSADMELEPLLATEWEATADDVWEFTLRDDVTFHDGSEFNAEVVKANIERILDEDVASPRSFLYNMVEEVVVVDDYTVEFHTEYPFAPLPSHLAHNGGGMISLEAIEADYEAMEDGGQPGDYINENPIGSGFFKFEEWQTGDRVELVRNDDYWGEPAQVQSVTFKVVPEDLTRIGELETGTAHIIDPVSPSDKARVENTDGIHVDETESLSLSYIGFNLQKEPFDDPLVRQALSMAINKDDIIEGVLEGTGTPAVGPIGEQVFGFSDEVEALPYDPERAQELLAEAGYEDGFETTIWTNDNRERMDMAELVQAQLAVIGVDAEIEVLEWGAYLDNTAQGEHDMFILGWVTVTGDADYGMHALFHSDNHGEAGNRSFISNDELDNLLDQAREETDESAREALYKEAMEILVDEAPMLYIYHQTYLDGVRDEVQGYWKHPNGLYQLHEVSIEN